MTSLATKVPPKNDTNALHFIAFFSFGSYNQKIQQHITDNIQEYTLRGISRVTL